MSKVGNTNVGDVDDIAGMDVKSKPRRRLDPDARRQQLLENAIIAFAEAGIERAVHADVAQRAGVSTPTVFKYFQTRDALVSAVLDRVEAKFFKLIERTPEDANVSAAEMTRRWSSSLTYFCETEPDLMKVALTWSVAFSSVRDRYLTFETQMLDMLKTRMSTSSTDRSDARIMLASATLYIRMHFDGSPEDIRLRYVERMAEILDAAPQQG